MPTNDEVYALLDAFYATLPSVNCKGECWNSCGPIKVSPLEEQRLAERGIHLEVLTHDRTVAWAQGQPLYCPALKDHRCSVYDIRPTICRLWGTARGNLACPHGCTLDQPRLRQGEILRLLLDGDRAGGADIPDIMYEMIKDPTTQEFVRRYIEGDYTVTDELVAAMRRVSDRQRARLGQDRTNT